MKRTVLLFAIMRILSGGSLSAIEVRNSGFEELIDNWPVHWGRSGRPVLQTAPHLVHSGSVAFAVARDNSLYQDIPVIPGIGHAVVAFIRGTLGGETAVTTDWFFPQPGGFMEFADSFSVGRNQTLFRLALRSLREDQWVIFDDIRVFSERIVNGGFEEETASWQLNSGARAIEDASAAYQGVSFLALPPGATASQRFAVNRGDQTFILRGVHRGADAEMAVRWRGMELNLIREDILEIPASMDWNRFEFFLVPPPDVGTPLFEAIEMEPVVADLILYTKGSGTAFDDLRLFWKVVLPQSFSPDGDGYRDRSEFTYFLDEEGSWNLRILSAAGQEIRNVTGLPARMGSNSFDWDGRVEDGQVAAPGEYRFQVEVRTLSGAEYVFEATTEITEEPPVPAFLHHFEEFIPRGLWFQASSFLEADGETRRKILEELTGAGFDTLYFQEPVSLNCAPLLEAAVDRNLLTFIGPAFFYYFLFNQAGYEDVSPQRVRAELERFEQTIPKNLLSGYQVLDEPGRAQVPLLQVYSRTIARLSPDIPPVTVVVQRDDSAGIVSALNSPVFIHDVYPTRRFVRVGEFPGFEESLSSASRTAERYGVPLWIMLPSFSRPHFERQNAPSETRCMAYKALLQGARGVFWFLGSESVTANGTLLMGMMNDDYVITDPAYAEVNAFLRELEPLLLAWKPLDREVRIDSPHSARFFQGPGETEYLFVVNGDCVRSRNVGVRATLPNARAVQDVRTGEAWVLERLGDEMFASVPLGEGNARVLEILPELTREGPHGLPREREPLVVIEPVLSFLEDFPVESLSMTGNRGVAMGHNRTALFDLSDPMNPVVSLISGIMHRKGIYRGNRLFLAGPRNGPMILDVSNFLNPVERFRFSGISGNAGDVAFDDEGRLFVAAQRAGVRVFEVREPDRLELLAASEAMSQAQELCIVEDLVFAFGLWGGSRVFRYLPSGEMIPVTEFPNLAHASDSCVRDGIVYLAAMDNGLVVIDALTDPPEIVTRIPGVEAMGLHSDGNRLYLADGAGAVRVFDLTDPYEPRFLFRFCHQVDGTISSVKGRGEFLVLGSPAGGLFLLNRNALTIRPSLQVR